MIALKRRTLADVHAGKEVGREMDRQKDRQTDNNWTERVKES